MLGGSPGLLRGRRRVIGVMGSGSDPDEARASALGGWLAGRGFHLLTGGGGGVMAAVSHAFANTSGRAGLVIGILPAEADDRLCGPPPGYPNPWVEVAIRTHLPLSGARGEEPLSRNHINVLSADAVIALAGGTGTLSEVRLALAYRRPVVAHLDRRADIPGLPEAVPLAPALAEVAEFLDSHLDPPPHP
jgi:uncharacterized protein (TIGR00725 family)